MIQTVVYVGKSAAMHSLKVSDFIWFASLLWGEHTCTIYENHGCSMDSYGK